MGNFFSSVDRLNRKLRLLFSFLFALAVAFIATRFYPGVITFLLSWIAFATSTLIFYWITILSKHPKQMSEVASQQDLSRVLIFLVVLSAAFISLFAIIFLLQKLPADSRRGLNGHILLAGAAVICSWATIHTLFTLRYAHLYYSFETESHKESGVHQEGLQFPGNEQPDFLDFAYFSFIIGMTFQVSDVSITAKRIRHLSLLHSLISFVFNTGIVALSINIISGLVGLSSH